jgi:hypothetical protein
MADLMKIVHDLSKLTPPEAAELAKMLEEKWERKKPPIPNLSTEESRSARADLEVLCAPKMFVQKLDALADRTTPKERFNEPRLGFLRDAMMLGEFARQLDGAKRVRLAAEGDRFPDGFVETSAGILNVEVTEADMETRRRGDEYKAGTVRSETVDEWEKQAKAIPVELDRAIGNKAEKNYDPRPTLVVYLNLNGHGTRKAEIESIIEDAKRKHALSFEGIYVLWNGRLL